MKEMAPPRQQADPFGADMGNSGHVLRHRPGVSSARQLGRSSREEPDLRRKCTINPTMGRALARTTEVLAPCMPSGSNAGNGHVRIKRPSPVLDRNSLTRPKIAGSCVTVCNDWTCEIASLRDRLQR